MLMMLPGKRWDIGNNTLENNEYITSCISAVGLEPAESGHKHSLGELGQPEFQMLWSFSWTEAIWIQVTFVALKQLV